MNTANVRRQLARKFVAAGGLAAWLGFASIAHAETATFHFAAVGTSFSAALPADSPLIGGEITSTRIYLDVESFPGSDAANFFTDISFPIDPFPGNESALVLVGVDLGWSGSGTFHHFEETARFNGIFSPFRYGGETPGENFDGLILDSSRIEFDYIPAGGGDLALTAAASRKTHDGAGAFEVDLPLTGTTGIENRGGKGEIVFTFNNPVTGAGTATSTCGTIGNIKVDPNDAHNLLVKFDGAACDQSIVTVTVNDVTDDQGHSLDSASVSFASLFGDVTADGSVDQADRAAVRAAVGQVLDNFNFRADINTDGRINDRDIGHVKKYLGDKLP